MLSSDHEILRPTARRTFELTPASSGSSAPATPYPEPANPNMLEPKTNSDLPPSRTRSILNLTSSTLFGIYSPTDYDTNRDEPSTPWGTGAQTPSGRRSQDSTTTTSPAIADWERPRPKQTKSASRLHQQQGTISGSLLPLALRMVLLSIFGVAYGIIITHLHDNHNLVPVRVNGIDRYSWTYLCSWGVAGVVLGSLLPWVDTLWDDKVSYAVGGSGTQSSTKKETGPNIDDNNEDDEKTSNRGSDWTPVVRSIGAFVGIAFAIRKLPWQSTLQVSLTLALANPFLWYLIDRTKPGFLLSSLVGLLGTAILLNINPQMVPSPATTTPNMPAGGLNASLGRDGGGGLLGAVWLEAKGLGVSAESVGVGTWIASVLFCSCVCFGNIGRRLGGRE